MTHAALREECCAANKRLPTTGLVDMTFGNVSVFDPTAAVFAIKPSGVAYDVLTPADIVVVDLDGVIVDGALRPSSDEPTHRRLLREFGECGVRSIVHTHSRRAVAFAQAGRAIPCLGTTHADFFRGEVPVTRALTPTEVVGAYEWETGNVIVECFAGRDPRDVPAVLVRHHGPYAWGENSTKALDNALALEIVAEMTLATLAISPSSGTMPEFLRDRHFLRKHGPGAYYGQVAAEKAG
jgi:L-ribulose-5-phosphate 4-epimerase